MKNRNFYCFSPLIMLTTFSIEIFLFIFVLVRYKLSRNVFLVAALLLFLAGFQISEYFICDGSSLGLGGDFWSRTAFVSITMLPPLGFHLMVRLGGKEAAGLSIGKLPIRHILKYGVLLNYVLGLLIAGYFVMTSDAISSYACGNNYAIFNLGPDTTNRYSVYYFLLLIEAVALGAFILTRKILVGDQARAVAWLVTGYLCFMVPTAALVLMFPQTSRGVPSVMCGFAVLLAFILSFAILPKVAKKRWS